MKMLMRFGSQLNYIDGLSKQAKQETTNSNGNDSFYVEKNTLKRKHVNLNIAAKSIRWNDMGKSHYFFDPMCGCVTGASSLIEVLANILSLKSFYHRQAGIDPEKRADWPVF